VGQLRVALLGTPDVRHAGQPLGLPTRKALALLAYLVVEGGVHPREKLAALFWPESATTRSRGALRYTLSCLRAALRHAAASSHLIEGNALGLDFGSADELDLDLRRFQATASPLQPDESRPALVTRLQQAADSWRGEFLEGFSLADAPEFDAWVTHQAEAWRRQMLSVLDRLSQAQEDAGLITQARETTERWARLSPLEERAQQRRIQLALVAGDRVAALQAYDDCRDMLRLELGVSPAPETEALGQRARVLTPNALATEVESRSSDHSHVLRHAPLVGRAVEFTQLVDAYYEARSGQPRALILQGEAGIGKTRLATEFIAWARARGADALAGRALEAGGRVPYQPLVEALRPRVERENAPDDLLSDVWLGELARLLPELADRYPDLQIASGDEAAARVRLFEAVARLGQALAAAPGRPVVLFVDDVQWADTATLDVLQYVARRWTELGVAVLLLLNVRVEALASDPELAEWFVGLDRNLPGTRVILGSLGAEATEELVRALGIGVSESVVLTELLPKLQSPGVVDFARWLFDETHGQPFFMTETLKALLERGALRPRQRDDGSWALEIQPSMLDDEMRQGFLPPGLREVLRARLARLSPRTGTLLVAAAVLGRDCPLELLARVAEIRDDEALPGLDEAVHGSLLRETSGKYAFTHDKIREVAYMEAGEARRRVFHRRALQALREHGASAAELVHHALASGLDDPAFELSLAAGDAALRLLAARDALDHYRRARAIAERHGWTHTVADLHVRFGKAFASLTQWVEARHELEAALETMGADETARRGEVLVDLLEVCWWSMEVPTMRRRAAELRALSEQLERPDLQIIALSWTAPALSADGDPAGCITVGEEALARGRALGFAPPPMMHGYMSLLYYQVGRFEEAVELSNEVLVAARKANHSSATLAALPHLGLSLAARGRYEEAARVFEDARRFGSEYGIGRLLARAIAMSAGYHLDVFDFAGNEALAEEARELARSLNFPPPAISAGLDLILNFARRQDVGRAEQLINEVAETAETATAWHGWLWGLRLAEARAEVALGRGNWEAARALATRTIELCRAVGRTKYEAIALTTRGHALVAVGRTTDALGDFRRAVELARQIGAPALFVRAASLLLPLDGNDALEVEAQAAIRQILAALPDNTLRHSFEVAEPVRAVRRVTL
jgi:DNA-binding SARP family transcriptional activator